MGRAILPAAAFQALYHIPRSQIPVPSPPADASIINLGDIFGEEPAEAVLRYAISAHHYSRLQLTPAHRSPHRRARRRENRFRYRRATRPLLPKRQGISTDRSGQTPPIDLINDIDPVSHASMMRV